ncbi:MAG: hypothetical protein ACFBSG_06695 [Leptolyngbyaceae cyanobacterium]
MPSACLACATPAGIIDLPIYDDLTRWQRFLQAEPLTATALSVAAAATWERPQEELPTVWEPLLQTAHHLTYNWITGSLVILGLTGTVGATAFSHLATVPAELDCSQLSSATIRNHVTCLQTAITAGDRQATRQGLAWVGHWQPQQPLFGEGQDLLEQWSRPVLREAEQARKVGDWVAALKLVAQVPASSPRYQDAQTLFQVVRTEQITAVQGLHDTAQRALQQSDWATAYTLLWQIQSLEHSTAPLPVAQQLQQQIEAERHATRLWNYAQHLWSDTPDDQAAAIALASQIATDTYLWPAVQLVVDRWSRELLITAEKFANKGDWKPALTMAKAIAQHPALPQDLRERLILMRAQHLTALDRAAESPPLVGRLGFYTATLSNQSIYLHGSQQPGITIVQPVALENLRQRQLPCQSAITNFHEPSKTATLRPMLHPSPKKNCRPQFSGTSHVLQSVPPLNNR